MPPRGKTEAKSELGDYFEAFADMVVSSVRFYFSFYGERAFVHEAWTRCSIIRDEIKERMIAFSDATPGFEVLQDGNATFFGAKSKFVIRPKKLFDNLKANTGKTQLSFDFDHQSPIEIELFEGLDPTNIYLGYVPTENEPLNPLVYLVCNNEEGEVEWSIPLNQAPPPPPAELIPLPTKPAPESAPRRVRVKKDAKKKTGNE